MSKTKIVSSNQSGGITANRINSPDTNIKSKIITRQRVDGFVAGILLSIILGIVSNLIYDWLTK